MIKKEDLERLEREELIKLVHLLDRKTYYMFRYKVSDDAYMNTKDEAARRERDLHLMAWDKVDDEIRNLLRGRIRKE